VKNGFILAIVIKVGPKHQPSINFKNVNLLYSRRRIEGGGSFLKGDDIMTPRE
jgi:hypothetical protein